MLQVAAPKTVLVGNGSKDVHQAFLNLRRLLLVKVVNILVDDSVYHDFMAKVRVSSKARAVNADYRLSLLGESSSDFAGVVADDAGRAA